MRKRELLNKYGKQIELILKISQILPKGLYKKVLKITRYWDSSFAIFIRYICVKNVCKACGKNTAIFSGVYILNPEKLAIGDNVSIHPMSYIDAGGGIFIGNDVSIAHSTTIMSEEHNFSDLNINIKDQGCKSIPTIIEENVWIGAGCRILGGAIIRKGCIIAAGAVVKKEVPQFSVVGGVPAKLLKVRYQV